MSDNEDTNEPMDVNENSVSYAFYILLYYI